MARFLVGEAFYREGDYEKAVTEFEAFLTLFPATRSPTSCSTAWP